MADQPPSDRAPRVDGMPILGLGTWQNTDPEQCAESVRTALEAGYRHVDTAQAYGNEAAVGRGVDRADVDRADVFVATKVWTDNLAPDAVRETARESIERLGTDYVDLLYVHWPAGDYDPEATLPAFAELHDEGLVRHTAVSNFTPELVDEATEVWGTEPFANQVEMHPLLPQEELRAHCEAAGVHVVAYSPLARGAVLDVPEIREVADDHGVSAAQVALAWVREKGATAIPKATSAGHVRDNWASLDLELDDEDVAAIDSIEREERFVDPSFAPW